MFDYAELPSPKTVPESVATNICGLCAKGNLKSSCVVREWKCDATILSKEDHSLTNMPEEYDLLQKCAKDCEVHICA